MTRIGVDASPLIKLHGGISYYIFHLLHELIRLRPGDQFFLFAPLNSVSLDSFANYINVVFVPISFYGLGHSIWAQTILSYACWVNKIDVFWGTTQSIPLIKRASMKTIIVLHDFVYLLCPETSSFVKKHYFRFFLRRMLQRASAIVPNSAGTGMKLRQIYKLGYTAVIEPPIKPLSPQHSSLESFLQKHLLGFKNYLVVVGTIEPRKNFQELIEVYLKVIKKEGVDGVLPLVVIGGGGWKNEKILRVLSQAQKEYQEHIHLKGYIGDEDLALFLAGARSYVMVSKYEGYGMPLAEARTCGTSVICLDQMEMREAAENDGIFLNSDSWQEEIQPYFLVRSRIKQPKEASYESNRDKAERLSKIINSL